MTDQLGEKIKHKVKMKKTNSRRGQSVLVQVIVVLFLVCDLCKLLAHSNTSKFQDPASNGKEKISPELPEAHSSFSLYSSLNSNFNRPEFDANQESLIVASRWQNEVFLPCKINNLAEEQTVSWIRKRDSLVLTVDKIKLIDDSRFSISQGQAPDWTLMISQPLDQDGGFYECQVSSMEPKMSRLVELKMIEAKSEIRSRESGISLVNETIVSRLNEELNLTCSIESAHKPDFVYWYKNKEPIQFDNLRLRPSRFRRNGDSEATYAGNEINLLEQGKRKFYLPSSVEISTTSGLKRQVSVSKFKQQFVPSKARDLVATKSGDKIKFIKSSSSLIIKAVNLNDTANYTCLPSNAKPSSVNVIVIQNGSQSQPEKRSLQVSDGASAMSQTLRFSRDRLLGQIFKLVSIGRLTSTIDTGKQPNLLTEIHNTITDQNLHRLFLTVLTIIFLKNCYYW